MVTTMTKLPCREDRVIDANDLFRKMCEVYGTDWDEAQEATFGDDATKGCIKSGDTTYDQFTRSVTIETIRANKVSISDVLCDLAERGELDHGRYYVRLSW